MLIHLVIIDAMNLIRRVHAVQSDPDDIKTTSIHCCQALNKIIHSSMPTHIVAVFDNNRDENNWRAKLLPQYKQGRKEMPQALQQGLGQIQDAFWQIGVDSLLSSGDEADDMIATLATKVAMRNAQVTIVSTDKGYCQLLQPNIMIRDYFQRRWLDLNYIEQKFAVLPNQLVDYWGLVGISSSNISGVPGIGAKSAAALLSRYSNLNALFKAADLEDKWRKKLSDNKELAFLCKQIATLQTDILLGFNLQDIRYQPQ